MTYRQFKAKLSATILDQHQLIGTRLAAGTGLDNLIVGFSPEEVMAFYKSRQARYASRSDIEAHAEISVLINILESEG
ncbi:hypothetical protein [Ktedonospora formicarum]|uniref:Uncharacterized protein n=1 Tax=Ktedonospora formicarum TaxID=2778364 RepID=A0A8J3MU90_9CHLR|nr:hypothetical protein [Ktedonospora formicarum]GHO45170.1 hypothetical protein KSX_33330 [Ktedonospora formicarum]